MIPTRAFENNLFLAYSNWAGTDPYGRYLGESVICDPNGRDVARAGAAETLIEACLDPCLIGLARARLPHLRDLGEGRYTASARSSD